MYHWKCLHMHMAVCTSFVIGSLGQFRDTHGPTGHFQSVSTFKLKCTLQFERIWTQRTYLATICLEQIFRKRLSKLAKKKARTTSICCCFQNFCLFESAQTLSIVGNNSVWYLWHNSLWYRMQGNVYRRSVRDISVLCFFITTPCFISL